MKILIGVYRTEACSLYIQYNFNERTYEVDYKRLDRYKDLINDKSFQYTTDLKRLDSPGSNLLFYVRFTNVRKL